jgi:hypothetical protein
MHPRLRVLAVVVVVVASVCAFVQHPHRARGRRYDVYWDQNEEEDLLSMPSGHLGQLIPPWDPNGQLCIVPDGSGRFVVGYNPTLPSQHNPGSLKPYKQPPVGEALYDRDGTFTGRTLYVPGPYHLPGQTLGGDIPPDAGSGAFNDNGTMTGCAFDHEANLFASDLGTAQGAFPPPDDGRIIEWFAPDYRTFCIVDGPTAGGDGPHHVDGTGGLRQPGDLAVDRNDDLMVPEAGAVDALGLPAGRVLRFAHASLPHDARACGADGLYPRERLHVSVFVQGSLASLPFPSAIARDPVCHCWAVDTTFGDPAVRWFDDTGAPVAGHGTVPGETLAQIGTDPNGYNPFGLAFAPDGTLYFVDIHITCTGVLTNCGPADGAGRVMVVRVTNGVAATAVTVASGYSFPTSVTTCDPERQTCPRPRAHAR